MLWAAGHAPGVLAAPAPAAAAAATVTAGATAPFHFLINFKMPPFNFLQTSKGVPLHVLRITLKFQTVSSSISLRYQRDVH